MEMKDERCILELCYYNNAIRKHKQIGGMKARFSYELSGEASPFKFVQIERQSALKIT